MSGEWAMPEVTEDGRYISGNHVLLHITGADCPCNNYGEEFPEEDDAPVEKPRLHELMQSPDPFYDEEQCEHGLSAWLCSGPMHYSDEF